MPFVSTACSHIALPRRYVQIAQLFEHRAKLLWRKRGDCVPVECLRVSDKELNSRSFFEAFYETRRAETLTVLDCAESRKIPVACCALPQARHDRALVGVPRRTHNGVSIIARNIIDSSGPLTITLTKYRRPRSFAIRRRMQTARRVTQHRRGITR